MNMRGRIVEADATVFAPSAEPGAAQNEKEIEVKFTSDPAAWERIKNSQFLTPVTEMRGQNLRTIYFDTPTDDLRKNGIVLRIRKKNRAAAVLGFKSAGKNAEGSFARKEVEVRSPDLQPNLALFAKNTAADLIRIVGDRPIEAKFETLINRQTILVRGGDSFIEVAFDKGHIVTGGQRVPLAEIELELKSGAETGLYDLAARLAKEFSLRLDFISKAEKGFRAIARKKPAPVKAKSVQLEVKATVENVITDVVSNTLAHFTANWAALIETEDPEAIHQLRVALRRLRSGLLMFKWALPRGEFDDLRNEAKRIAAALGLAREWDVLRAVVRQMPLLREDCPAACEALLTALEDCRSVAYKNARAVIESRNTTDFVLKVQSFLASRAWRIGLGKAERRRLNGTAKKFARRALTKLNARVLKRGKEFSGLSKEGRHKLRIALKNLRYGTEFFSELFGRGRVKRSYIKTVSILQHLLGAQHDVVSAKKILPQLSALSGPGSDRAAGFVTGWLSCGYAVADEDICKAWKKFKKTGPHWY